MNLVMSYDTREVLQRPWAPLNGECRVVALPSLSGKWLSDYRRVRNAYILDRQSVVVMG